MTSFAPLTHENTYLPLAKALEHLSSELANGKWSPSGDRALARARTALERLTDLPSEEEVAAEYLSESGPLAATFTQVEQDGRNSSGEYATHYADQLRDQVRMLLFFLAKSPSDGANAFAKVTTQPELLSAALREAHKDGAERGGYISTAREEAVNRFIDLVAHAAQAIP